MATLGRLIAQGISGQTLGQTFVLQIDGPLHAKQFVQVCHHEFDCISGCDSKISKSCRAAAVITGDREAIWSVSVCPADWFGADGQSVDRRAQCSR